MKKIILTTALTLAISGIAMANTEKVKENEGTEVEASTSHNPITKTTKHKVERKAKYSNRKGDAEVNNEDTYKYEKKVKDDGSSKKVTTEQKHEESHQ